MLGPFAWALIELIIMIIIIIIINNLRSETMAGVNYRFVVVTGEEILQKRKRCVVAEFVYANTITMFNLVEQWLLEYSPQCFACWSTFCPYSPQFQRIIVNYTVEHES